MKPMGDEQLFAIDEQVDQGYGDFNLEACGVNIGDTIIYIRRPDRNSPYLRITGVSTTASASIHSGIHF